jgi:hypothetical protein
MQQLIEDAATELRLPSGLLGQIKTNLNIDRDIGAEIIVATDEYNIAVCRKLAEGMRSKLPRELRDMVYQHLCPGILTVCTDFICCSEPHTYCLDEGTGTIRRHQYNRDALSTDFHSLYPEHYLRYEVLGVDIAHELSELHSRESTCIMMRMVRTSTDENGKVLLLSEDDRLERPTQPSNSITEIARKLYVAGDTHTHAMRYVAHNKEQIRSSVKELFSLPRKSRIQLIFRLGTTPIRERQPKQEVQDLNILMDGLFPTLVRLQRAKYELTVKLSGRTYEELTRDVLAEWMAEVDSAVATEGIDEQDDDSTDQAQWTDTSGC